jgi:hypothetical protein
MTMGPLYPHRMGGVENNYDHHHNEDCYGNIAHLPFLDNDAIHMPYRSGAGATSGGEACQHIERMMSSRLRRSHRQQLQSQEGKLLKMTTLFAAP